MQKFLQISDKLQYLFLLFLISFIPLYPKFPLLNVKGTYVAVRIEDIIIALALLFWCISIYKARKIRNFFQDKLNQAIILFLFIGGVSLFSGIFLTQTVVSPNLGILHFIRRIEFIFLLPFAYTAVKNKKNIEVLLITFSVTVFLINLYAFGQKFLGLPVISTTNSEYSKGLILYLAPDARVNSTFAGHYDLAVYLVMVLVVSAALFFGLKKIYWMIWIAILGLMSFVVLVMTAARLSFVAVIVGIITSLILASKKLFILAILIIAALALIYPSQLRDRFLSTITINLQQEGERFYTQNKDQENRSKLNIPTLPGKNHKAALEAAEFASATGNLPTDIVPGEPIDETQLGVYRSFAIRLNVEWPRAIKAVLKNPFLGTGYSSLGIATDNDFLRSLGEVGILGSLAFVLIIVEILKRLWKIYAFSDKFFKYLTAGVISVVIAFLINGLFIDVFESSKITSIFWLIIGASLAVEKFR